MLIDALHAIQKRHGHLPEDELLALSERDRVPLHEIQAVASFYPHFRLRPRESAEIEVCADLSCHLRGACELRRALEAAARERGGGRVEVKAVSCLGQCDAPPAASLDGVIVRRLSPRRAGEVVERLASGRPWRRPPAPPPLSDLHVHPDGADARYAVLARVREENRPEAVIAVLKESGLRGMGGAGFPTGLKWEIVRSAPGEEKFVVCNADESEPGTFKDRALMESVPHLVLEGMAIGAFVTGAKRAILYLRHEYDRSRDALRRALREAARFDLGCEISLFDSPGGYICGEETALLETLEGRRAEPRNKPPFPGTHGLYQKPTLINNVETFALVPAILGRGASWFASQGRSGGRGLKFLALSGHVRRPGVYEVPLGIAVRELIETHGGGVVNGRHRRLKAFAPGGASSGFLPAARADVPLEFKALADAGSMLGSGAVVAVAEPTCMLDLATNVVRFFRNESCGKCVPCRVGSEKLVTLLEGIAAGRGQPSDLDLVFELADTMKLTSICGLGQAAPLPITSVIQHFRGEIEDHVHRRRCPSGACALSG